MTLLTLSVVVRAIVSCAHEPFFLCMCLMSLLESAESRVCVCMCACTCMRVCVSVRVNVCVCV